MKQRIRLQVVGPLAVTLCLCMFAATTMAATGAGYRQAIQNFDLNGDFLAKYENLMAQTAKQPCKLNPAYMPGLFVDSQGKPLAFAAAAQKYDSQPDVHETLTKIGLTARQVLAGMSTIMAASVQATEHQYPDLVKKEQFANLDLVNSKSMAFYHKHEATMNVLARHIGDAMFGDNGKNPPKCLSQ